MNRWPRIGYVVVASSDVELAHLTIDSILQQDQPSDLIVVAASEHSADALKSTVKELGPIEFVSVPSFGRTAPRQELYQRALTAAASSVDIIVFCSDGAVFQSDHLKAIVRRFGENEELVGAIEVFGKVRDFDPVSTSKQPLSCRFLPNGWPKNGAGRRWWHSKILTECTFTARTASLRGLSFERFATKFDWTAFSDMGDRLRVRGRVSVSPTRHGVAVRRVERRSGFDQGYETYCAMRLANDHRPHAIFAVTLETFRLAMEPLRRALNSSVDRRWCISFLRGLWTARAKARSIRKAMERDIGDLA
jgi:hypothetical protein